MKAKHKVAARKTKAPALILDPRNAKRHSDRNKKAIRQSLESVGPFRSIGAVRGVVKVGNGVFEQAQDLGLKVKRVKADRDTLVVVDRDDLTDAEADRAAMLDNIAADSSAFDYEAARFAEQVEGDALLKQMASEEAKYRELLKGEAKQEPVDPGELIDKAVELQKKWQVKRGDIWTAGCHRLMCGDSTSKEDVARLMDGKRAQLLASDPPYNVGIDYGEKVDDALIEADYEEFSRLWFGAWRAVTDSQIVTPGCYNLARWVRYFEPYHVAPWTKTNSMTNGKVARFWCWEPMLFYGGKWKRRRPNDVFDYPISNQKNVANHPCPKPLPMWVDLIENYSETGDLVADAFDGSGTTLVACEQTGRIGVAMEIEPKFVSCALERLSLLGLTCERVG